MINSLHKLATAVMAAVAVLSCQKQELEKPELVTYNLVFSSEQEKTSQETKTAWDGADITWTKDDAISVTYTLDGAWASTLYRSRPLAEDCLVAEFSTSVNLPNQQTGNMVFHAVYPASCVVGNLDKAPTVKVQLPSVQKPSSASFDASADLMRAQTLETFASVPTTPIPLLWNRLVAHADITMLLPSIQDSETIESVEFTAQEGASLTGSYVLDLATREMTPEAAYANVVINAENLSFRIPYLVKTGKEDSFICLFISC